MSNNYVVRLQKAECDMGSMQNYLNVDEDHGVVFGSENQPVMNANDHVQGRHITHFGRCGSIINPDNIKTGFNCLANPLATSTAAIKALIGCGGCKCIPMTFVPWIDVQQDTILEGAPSLTDKSKLPCFWGGTITIVTKKETE